MRAVALTLGLAALPTLLVAAEPDLGVMIVLVLIVGGQSDTVAPVNQHSIPFYNSLGGPKGYVELAGASHFFPQSANPTASRALVSWFKRWLNQDARFTPFTCGFTGSAVSNFRSNAC